MAVKKVALIGADGKLGPHMLKALVKGGFELTVLKRQSSKTPSIYPQSVKETRVPDSFNPDELEPLLRGLDAIVVTTSGSLIDMQKSLALAAARAGVQRFIPADFGSVDSETELSRRYVPLYTHKRNLRLYLSELAAQYPDFSWTSLVPGHFFDWSLEFMHIWPQERVIDVLDDGSVRASASSLGQISQGTVRILQRAEDEDTRNRILYVQSFCKTQMEIKEALERVTGEKWNARSHASDKFLAEKKTIMDAGGQAGKDATEEVVWWLGAKDANWEGNDGFAMDLLGLEEEDLDTVVKAALVAG